MPQKTRTVQVIDILTRMPQRTSTVLVTNLSTNATEDCASDRPVYNNAIEGEAPLAEQGCYRVEVD